MEIFGDDRVVIEDELPDAVDRAVALAEGRVASLGPELPGWVGPDTKVFEAQGQYLLPGLIDAHYHGAFGSDEMLQRYAEVYESTLRHRNTSLR